MPIGFARVEFVKRSANKNACAKSAYISRSKVEFNGNCVAKPAIYDWSRMGCPAYHEVLLPENVDAKFKSLTVLWNEAEQKEVRENAQVAMELVLALPDDQEISLEDRIELLKSYVQKHYVDKGLAVQIAIHPPEKRLIITSDNKELRLEKGMMGHVVSQSKEHMEVKLVDGKVIAFNPNEFTGFVENDHNWHAHAQITTRRFKENGLELEDKKARDLMPSIRIVNIDGRAQRVVSGVDNGKLWAEHQNEYFHAKGIDLQVDSAGIITQEHLGATRLRARSAFALLEEQYRRIEENQILSSDPEKILESITKQKSVFTKSDFEQFLTKNTPSEAVETVTKEFWQLPQLIQLADKKTGKLLPKYTSQAVIEEEKQILRLTDRLNSREAIPLKTKYQQAPTHLNAEQLEAYQQIVKGKRLALIQGYAGTGKSHVLSALKTTYENAGYKVRGMGPDEATAKVLKEKGFSKSENVYKFLKALYHERRTIENGREVWILDETGKLGNRPLLELLKEAAKRNVQVVLAGDSAQLPSVERGGMFKILCNRYGAQQLIDIQRQKNTKQREIAHNLATGDYGTAIDKLSNAKGLIWTENRQEAMEELVMRWAQDTQAFPSSSTLIIAHSNDEVRVLNEMVRQVRKERGELGEKEYLCTTTKGKIYVSVGDRIEFRQKDLSIGVSNGLSGVLVEAKPNKFVVALEEGGKKQQTVVFNPEKYHAFQLGYASTYYRSQGHTIDRGYVLHSSMLNKELFYVGLTRHVKDVSYFLSKDEVNCLSELKHLTTRSAEKTLTVEFTTQSTLDQQKAVAQRQLQIQDLIKSDSLLTRMKGFGLSTWDKMATTTTHMKEHIQDRLPNRDFYKSHANPKQDCYPVLEITQPTYINNKTTLGETMTHAQPNPDASPASDFEKPTLKLLDHATMNPKMSPALKEKFKDYFVKTEKAAALKTMVDLEVESTSKDPRLTSYFRQWQECCGSRNQEAHAILGHISSDEKREINPRTLSIVQEQAERYEAFLVKQNKSTQLSLEDQLKANIEAVLYRLYPEGPTSRNRTHYRFGNKGSISVAHSGPKAGSYRDFEQQTGGGLLKLIQRGMGLGPAEAKTWAQNFLSTPSEVSIPPAFSRPVGEIKAEDTWVSMMPDATVPAPSLDQLKGKKLAYYCNEVMRHPYRDADGQLLYYVLRLQDKQDPKKKVTPPLSYGYWKSQPELIRWELKGYQSEQKHLYNLHLLKQNPKATVLIVEGEKTADHALSRLPGENYICMTWPGGASSVSKADWTPLIGRNVLVWPDNDQAGYLAGEKVCHELRKVGVESLKLVHTGELKKHFPEKWDLADKLPDGMSEQMIKKLLAKADQKGINPEQVMIRLSMDPKNTLDRTRINEILWRVDERSRPELEEKYGNQLWKVQDEILRETQQLFLNQAKQKIAFRDKFGMDSVALESLTYQVCLAQAKHGRDLRVNEVDIIKETIQKQGYISMPKVAGKEATQVLTDRLLSKDCEQALGGTASKDQTYAKSQEGITVSLERIERQKIQINTIIESIKQQEIVKNNGLGIKL